MSNKKKSQQLGMAHGTAVYHLKKMVMFSLLQETGKDACYQCGEKIKDIDNLSLEHKVPWLDSDNPKELFYNLSNIAFSHTICNYAAKRHWNISKQASHGTASRYITYGCRCDNCTKANRNKQRKYRAEVAK